MPFHSNVCSKFGHGRLAKSWYRLRIWLFSDLRTYALRLMILTFLLRSSADKLVIGSLNSWECCPHGVWSSMKISVWVLIWKELKKLGCSLILQSSSNFFREVAKIHSVSWQNLHPAMDFYLPFSQIQRQCLDVPRLFSLRAHLTTLFGGQFGDF